MKTRFVVAMATLLAAGSSDAAHRPDIDPEDYPSLSAQQLGHLRHIVRMVHAPLDDTHLWGDSDAGARNDSAQFQIAFMAYALGAAHYHWTPAYRELYQHASFTLIEKMMDREVWGYWADMSRAAGDPGWIDPVAKSNIMYSGHLLQMVSLHESLFNDHRYDSPGSLVFEYASGSYGELPMRFVYGHGLLAEVLYRQFVDDEYRGIECARGSVFSDCNQHPILGLIQFDQTHATDYSVDVQLGFQQTIDERGYISPLTHTTMHKLDVKSDTVIPATSAYLDGWNGHAYHVWAKEFVETIYREQVKLYVPAMFEGEPGEDMGSDASYDFGWFALFASEVGDADTVTAMLDYADANFDPTWRDGAFYYPFTTDYKTDFRRDEHGRIQNVSPITGNVLLGFTRLNPKDGMWELYNRPLDEAHFGEPYIDGVDHQAASVSQAFYDDDKDTLIVTLVPGPVESDAVSFTVRQLASRAYSVLKNGEPFSDGVRWNADGTLTLSTALPQPATFLIYGS